jgi:hypothetical protein
VVEEVFLELIEHDQQHAPDSVRQGVEPGREGQLRIDGDRAAEGVAYALQYLLEEGRQGLVPPGEAERDRQLWRPPRYPIPRRLLLQATRESSPQHRTLADAAGAVHEREPRGGQIGDQHFRFAVAADEVFPVLFAVGH